jgi:hypothetical protein
MTTIIVRKRKRLPDVCEMTNQGIEHTPRRTNSGHTPRQTLTAADLNLLIKSRSNNSVGKQFKGN